MRPRRNHSLEFSNSLLIKDDKRNQRPKSGDINNTDNYIGKKPFIYYCESIKQDDTKQNTA